VRVTRLLQQRRSNLLWTAAILGALAVLLGALGWLASEVEGVLVALAIGGLVLSLQEDADASWLRRQLGTEPIPRWLAPDLHCAAAELARRAGLSRVPQLHYLPTPGIQALAVGDRETSAVGLSDGLLRLLSPRETVAVLAHEIWHIRERDLRLMRLALAAVHVTQALSTATLALYAFFLPWTAAEGLPEWWLLLAVALAPTLATLLWLGLSRTREFDADAGAAALTGDPEALASALARLDRVAGRHWERIAGRRRSRFLSTHPSAKARIERLLELVPPRRRFYPTRTIWRFA
jgi:heat shock protein HtpX